MEEYCRKCSCLCTAQSTQISCVTLCNRDKLFWPGKGTAGTCLQIHLAAGPGTMIFTSCLGCREFVPADPAASPRWAVDGSLPWIHRAGSEHGSVQSLCQLSFPPKHICPYAERNYSILYVHYIAPTKPCFITSVLLDFTLTQSIN